MQVLGHQVVGSNDISHENVKQMYEKFFGGESVQMKRVLKTKFQSFKARQMLSQIFQVYSAINFINCITP